MAAKLNPAPKLRVRDLGRRYGSFVALTECSFDMPAGEFLTLLGPSGSGKTTLLSLIAGLSFPDHGQIWIDGRDTTAIPSKARDLGLVFQGYALFPHLSVFENVAFPLRMRRKPEAEIKRLVGEGLEVVRLSGLAERLPAELSGGQQQRVALARCFVYRPSIILMDEPLGALDKQLRDHMQSEILRLVREFNASVIYVTHDQEEALVMSDRILLMREGRCVQAGSPQDLYFAPQSRFAATFLGQSNLIDVQMRGGAAVWQDQVWRCRATMPIDDGPALLMLRPESLRLLAPGEAADNQIAATVERIQLTGALTRIDLVCAGGVPLSCSFPSRWNGPVAATGAVVTLGFDAGAAIALPP